MAQGKEALPDSFGGFGGFEGESENEFSPFQAAKTDKLPPFPEPCLPGPLWDMTAAMAENLQTAGDMFGTNLLAACAICLQGKFSVNPKPGWLEPLNLYTVTIARPSERKSPALSIYSNLEISIPTFSSLLKMLCPSRFSLLLSSSWQKNDLILRAYRVKSVS